MKKQKLFFKVDEHSKVTYFVENSEGTKELTHPEYVQARCKEAEELYPKVVQQAKLNGCVYIGWVQRHFPVDYIGASFIVDKMIEEGICGEMDVDLGARKIIVAS